MKLHFAITALLGLMEPHQVRAVKVEDDGTEEVRSNARSTCFNHLTYFDCVEDPSYCEWNCKSKTCVPLKPECHLHECPDTCNTDPVNDCKWNPDTNTCDPHKKPHPCSLNRNCDACDNDWRNDCEWDCKINRCKPFGQNCSDHKCSKPCHNDGCYWHSETNTCENTLPENPRCEVINNMYACVEDSKCEWDCHNRTCKTVQPNCTDHTCRDACADDPYNTCYWDSLTSTCGTEEPPKVPTCEDNGTDYYKCVNNPNFNCEWDCEQNTCKTKGFNCSDHKCQQICNADQENNCKWNMTSASCESESEETGTCKDNVDPYSCLMNVNGCEWDCSFNTCK